MISKEFTKIILGGRVTSKKTGLPGVFKVCRISAGPFYCFTKGAYTKEEALEKFPRWTELYPNWPDNPIVDVLFPSPRKPCSLEEVINNGGTKEDWDKLPETSFASYPIEDLESFDE